MATEQDPRALLRRRLIEVLGDEPALTLMGYLPMEDVASTGDVAELKGDVAELKADVAELKADMAAVKERMEHGFALVDQKLETLEYKLLHQMQVNTRTIFYSHIGSTLTLALVLVAALRLV